MSDFVVKQGDTVSINYVIPSTNLFTKRVVFCFGDKRSYSKRVTCTKQKIASAGYISLHAGGIAIPFTGDDLKKPGYFSAQFEIISRNGDKKTYPSDGYLRIEVQQSI